MKGSIVLMFFFVLSSSLLSHSFLIDCGCKTRFSNSAGKSSLLESICGRALFPRGASQTTRAPLELRQIRTKDKPELKAQAKANGAELSEDATFFAVFPTTKTHQQKIALTEADVQAEVTRRTGKGISSVPIKCTVYACDVVSIRLLDLPGLIASSKEADEAKTIADLVKNEVDKPDRIVLVVQAATASSPWRNCQAMQFLNASQKRAMAIGVNTKCDMLRLVGSATLESILLEAGEQVFLLRCTYVSHCV